MRSTIRKSWGLRQRSKSMRWKLQSWKTERNHFSPRLETYLQTMMSSPMRNRWRNTGHSYKISMKFVHTSEEYYSCRKYSPSKRKGQNHTIRWLGKSHRKNWRSSKRRDSSGFQFAVITTLILTSKSRLKTIFGEKK